MSEVRKVDINMEQNKDDEEITSEILNAQEENKKLLLRAKDSVAVYKA